MYHTVMANEPGKSGSSLRLLRQLCVLAMTGVVAVACSSPTTQLPPLSAVEVDQERQRQQRYAQGGVTLDYNEVKFSASKRKAMQQRVQSITNKLTPHATTLCYDVNGPNAQKCDMHIELKGNGRGVNAYADGKKIVLHPAMVDFAQSDTHLALVIAHEYTHHMMGHVESAQQNVLAGVLMGAIVDVAAAAGGANTQGGFSKMGAQAGVLQYSPSFEQEADYIALYILARAGYNLKDAPEFWRKMARHNPQGITNRTTHPTTPERFVLMAKTISEIEMKQKRGLPLLPNMLPQS